MSHDDGGAERVNDVLVVGVENKAIVYLAYIYSNVRSLRQESVVKMSPNRSNSLTLFK